MANDYFSFTSQIARFTTASANRLNSIFKSIETGFDKLPSATELNQGSRNYSVATLSGTTYTATVPFDITSYSDGLTVTLSTAQQNPGSASLNLNGISAATIRRFDGSNLVPGDIKASSLNNFAYDGSSFRLLSMHGGSETIATNAATSAANSASSASTSASAASSSASQASTSATIASSAASSATDTLTNTRFGFRNILINPLFWVSQWLGTSSSSAFSGTHTAGSYIRDRWKAGTSGVTFSVSSYTMTISSGSIIQVIQGRNIPVTGSYTLSWEGTAAARVNGVSVTNGGTVTLTTPLNATVEFLTGTVRYPQLEIGASKTQFEFRPTDIELLMCYQYFQKSYLHEHAPGLITDQNAVNLIALNGAQNAGRTWFPITMRASAVVRTYSPRSGLYPRIFNYNTNADVVGTAWFLSSTGFHAVADQSNFSIGFFTSHHWTADAEL